MMEIYQRLSSVGNLSACTWFGSSSGRPNIIAIFYDGAVKLFHTAGFVILNTWYPGEVGLLGVALNESDLPMVKDVQG
jgi:hypothetical protein